MVESRKYNVSSLYEALPVDAQEEYLEIFNDTKTKMTKLTYIKDIVIYFVYIYLLFLIPTLTFTIQGLFAHKILIFQWVMILEPILAWIILPVIYNPKVLPHSKAWDILTKNDPGFNVNNVKFKKWGSKDNQIKAEYVNYRRNKENNL